MTAAADLTADQQAAADAFAAWLKQPVDGTPFVLSGFAGSGKTFVEVRWWWCVLAANRRVHLLHAFTFVGVLALTLPDRPLWSLQLIPQLQFRLW